MKCWILRLRPVVESIFDDLIRKLLTLAKIFCISKEVEVVGTGLPPPIFPKKKIKVGQMSEKNESQFEEKACENSKNYSKSFQYLPFREVLCLDISHCRIITGCSDGKVNMYLLLLLR